MRFMVPRRYDAVKLSWLNITSRFSSTPFFKDKSNFYSVECFDRTFVKNGRNGSVTACMSAKFILNDYCSTTCVRQGSYSKAYRIPTAACCIQACFLHRFVHMFKYTLVAWLYPKIPVTLLSGSPVQDTTARWCSDYQHWRHNSRYCAVKFGLGCKFNTNRCVGVVARSAAQWSPKQKKQRPSKENADRWLFVFISSLNEGLISRFCFRFYTCLSRSCS